MSTNKLVIKFPSSLMVLTILFAILKLTETINWSWWLVFAPMWIPAAIGLTLVVSIFFFALLAAFLKS